MRAARPIFNQRFGLRRRQSIASSRSSISIAGFKLAFVTCPNATAISSAVFNSSALPALTEK